MAVIAISVDPDSALYSWARDDHFPMLFASDSGLVAGKLYGAASPRGYEQRFLFVVGPDGRITHRMVPFNVLSAGAYKELQAAVDSASGGSGAGPN